MTDKVEFRKHDYEAKNVRFLGYNFLKNVTFNGEPVVPVILSEEDVGDKHFKVEKLGGQDLNAFVHEPISITEKLKVFDHVAGQLQAIDAAGMVLFDRLGRNIRVLSSGKKGISTRQMDIEYFYDKKADAIYSDSLAGERHYEQYAFTQKLRRWDLWSEAVQSMAFDLLSIKDIVKFIRHDSDFWEYRNLVHSKSEFPSRNLLADFRKNLGIVTKAASRA